LLGCGVRPIEDRPHNTIIKISGKLSSIPCVIEWIDMLPSPSVVSSALNANDRDCDWKFSVDPLRRLSYDMSEFDSISDFFKGHFLDNFAMAWMRYLTGGKLNQLKKFLNNVVYSDDALATLEKDGIGRKLDIFYEDRKSPVLIEVTKISPNEFDLEPEVVGYI